MAKLKTFGKDVWRISRASSVSKGSLAKKLKILPGVSGVCLSKPTICKWSTSNLRCSELKAGHRSWRKSTQRCKSSSRHALVSRHLPCCAHKRLSSYCGFLPYIARIAQRTLRRPRPLLPVVMSSAAGGSVLGVRERRRSASRPLESGSENESEGGGQE